MQILEWLLTLAPLWLLVAFFAWPSLVALVRGNGNGE